MSNPPASTPSRGGGLSLYANLLDPPSSSHPTTDASITRGPVVFKQGSDGSPNDDASAKKQRINTAALRFQPTKRPQLSNQKAKPKSTIPKLPVQGSSGTVASTQLAPSVAPSVAPSKTIADWTAQDDDDVNGFYGQEKRQRGGRKRRKKNKEDYAVVQDWDDIYNPARPNNYDEYKHSDEKIREVREWKDRLYSHRMARKHDTDTDSDEDDARPRMNNQFAPPSAFAPPSNHSFAPPPIEPPASIPDHATGDDTYERRLKMSQAPPPPPPSQANLPPPPPSDGAVISRAPVRHTLPPPPPDLPTDAELDRALADEAASEDEYEPQLASETPAAEEEAPRSRRPGQKGFAERLMSKYGWSKGEGLGADGSGIVNPLRVLVEKRKKKPDSEGGGFVDPKGGRGKIVGGKKRDVPAAASGSEGGKGAMSEVVALRGMVDGMNLDEDDGEGGLMQEIGEECGEKYGRVERVFIYRGGNEGAVVFVKFTSQLSALRAVNALEGRIFNGNTISAMFYDAEKFEDGLYT